MPKQRTRITKNCLVCDQSFTTVPSRIKLGLGKYCSRKCYYKGRPPYLTGENHPNWVGDKVNYTTLHVWVKRWRGAPSLCENCGSTTATKYEWANLSGEYLRDLDDWARLCRHCHMLIDDISRKISRTHQAKRESN